MALAALLAVAGVMAASACSATPKAPPAARRARHAVGPVSPAGPTMLASFRRAVPSYARPDGTTEGTIPPDWHGVRSVLPVIAVRRGWLHVRLAQRPDGATAWIPARDARLSSTPYRIVINLATTHLTLYKDGRKVFSAPAGVGTRQDPTPTGHFFVAFLEAPPASEPGYGAFIMVTSAHSQTIRDWDGSGDAVIGIHGPLGSDAQISTTGSRISHGCVRLHESALLRLRNVPAGSPVDITG